MPRASAADAARTAERVLAHAVDLFGERGHAAVSLDDVARAAGVTRGAVYHHYGSKDGLFRAAAERLQGSVAQMVAETAEREADPARQLRAGCHAFLDAITSPPHLRILLIDAPAVIGWAEWRRMDAENSETHLRDALAQVGVDAELVDAVTALLSGAMNEAAVWIAHADDPVAASRRAHRALDALLPDA